MIRTLRFASSLFTAAALSLSAIGLTSMSATALANGGPLTDCGIYSSQTKLCSNASGCGSVSDCLNDPKCGCK